MIRGIYGIINRASAVEVQLVFRLQERDKDTRGTRAEHYAAEYIIQRPAGDNCCY